MEKIFSHSAKLLFGYMFYEMYNYYKFTRHENMMKTAINIDLSFEKIEKEIIDRDVLIATSINQILYKDKQKNFFYIKNQLEAFDEKNNIMKVILIK